VLGGGSALGWAHIGILRFLEEQQIPIDSVVGTSAGGLVGGLYAVGLSPTEIKELLSHIRWEDTFTGQPAYRDLSFRRKEDRRDYQFRYEVGLRGGLRFPSGLDPAQPIGLILSRVCLPASPIGEGDKLKCFSDLVLPFRAVSVDLNEGIEYVPRKGSLVQALRATMAIPVVFTPVIAVDPENPSIQVAEASTSGHPRWGSWDVLFR
jgi:NTE family protein